MAQQIKVWYDPEGDFLEVLFSDKAGYMKETNNDAVMERVDEQGTVLGFTVLESPVQGKAAGSRPDPCIRTAAKRTSPMI